MLLSVPTWLRRRCTLSCSQPHQDSLKHQSGSYRIVSRPLRIRKMMHGGGVDLLVKSAAGLANPCGEFSNNTLVSPWVFVAKMNLDGNSGRPDAPSQISNG